MQVTEYVEIGAGKAIEIDAGNLSLRVVRRRVAEDGGISIEVCGPVDGAETQLIRFDLFRGDPHYHVPSSDPKPIRLEGKSADEAMDFALGCIRARLPELLREAGYSQLAGAASAEQRTQAALRVEEAAQQAPEPEPADFQRIELTPEVRRALGE